MWFSGFFLIILSLIVEVYLWWKLQASLIFLSGRTCTIGGWLNTFLPHCISSLFLLTIVGGAGSSHCRCTENLQHPWKNWMQRPQCDHLRPLQHCTSGAKITFLTHLILFFVPLNQHHKECANYSFCCSCIISLISSPRNLVFLHLSLQGPLYGFLFFCTCINSCKPLKNPK